MSESEPQTQSPLPLHVVVACDVATGTIQSDPAACAIKITAARKDLNAKGRGATWYRMVLRSGQWKYFADGRLPSGNFLACDRRASVRGKVYEGELVCRHHKGGQVDSVQLVVDSPSEDGNKGQLVDVDFVAQRNGLRITLPTGAMITAPDPRAR